MDNNFKILIGSVIATIFIIIAAVFLFSSNPSTPDVDTTTPIDPQILVRDNGYNIKGPSDAPVTIVEYADFQCPGCKDTVGVINAIAGKYSEQVRIVYRHFPLPQHPLAQPAAVAAEAAGGQDKFWEMHDLIFKNQENLSTDSFEQFAQQLDLNMEQFKADVQSETFRERVQADLQTTRQLGLRGTPTLFINGKVYNQSLSVDGISTVIEQELALQLLPSAEDQATNSANPQATESSELTTPAATESSEDAQ